MLSTDYLRKNVFIFFSEALSGDQPPEPQPVVTQQPVADGSQQPQAQPAGNQPT